MPLLDGFPGVSGATDFGELRKLLSGLIVRNADGTPRAGVLRDPSTPLVTGRTDLKVDVATFPFATVRDGGVILGMNEGTTQVALEALPTANQRIDILWARQNIGDLADGSDLPTFGWTKGDAAAIPEPPTTPLPAGALEVARVQVSVGTTATNDTAKVTITQTAPHTATVGGLVPFRTEAALKLWAAAESSRATALDTGRVFVRTGNAWVVAGPTYGTIAGVSGTNVNALTKIIRDPDGWVHGVIDLTRGGGLGSDIAVIGAGFRPLAIYQGPGAASEGGTAGFAFIRIATNGNISVLSFPAGDVRVQFPFGYQS